MFFESGRPGALCAVCSLLLAARSCLLCWWCSVSLDFLCYLKKNLKLDQPRAKTTHEKEFSVSRSLLPGICVLKVEICCRVGHAEIYFMLLPCLSCCFFVVVAPRALRAPPPRAPRAATEKGRFSTPRRSPLPRPRPRRSRRRPPRSPSRGRQGPRGPRRTRPPPCPRRRTSGRRRAWRT